MLHMSHRSQRSPRRQTRNRFLRLLSRQQSRRMKMKKLRGLVFMIALGLLIGSCSRLQNNALAPLASQSDIHPTGWATQSSANFHGMYIKTHDFDMTPCTSCHGNDLRGGTVQVTCYNSGCHQGSEGTLACFTCHGSATNPAPPKDLNGGSLTTGATGAHQNHLLTDGPFDTVSCSACHVVPQAAGPGLHPYGGEISVTFSGLAVTQTNLPGSQYYDAAIPTVIPSPNFDSQTQKCSNTYCHGDFKGGNNFSPKWTVVDGSQDSCGSCHGTPPQSPDHPQTVFDQTIFYNGRTQQNCYFCHEPMIGRNGIQDSSLHVNGKLELQGRSLPTW
jgi:predicted CxxxxCH...CXXCH cytochrome family protein